MTTLIRQIVGDDAERRCDAHCYLAAEPFCTCICGGVNHGVGRDQALANTQAIAEELLAREGVSVLGAELPL